MSNDIQKDIKLLDELVAVVKSKNKEESFNIKGLQNFEFIFFTCLDIVRYELQKTGEISDLTGEAIIQLFVFQSFEYYNGDFPNVYKKCRELFVSLRKYNQKFENYELGATGVENKNWIRYFSKIFPKLI